MKLKWLFVAMLVAGFVLTGCNDGGGEENSLPEASAEIPEGYLRVNMQGHSNSFYLWAWKDIDAEESAKCTNWAQGGIPFDHYNGDFTCVDIKLNDPASSVGLIVKSYDGGTKYTGDSGVIFYFPNKYHEIYFKNESGTIYVERDFSKEPIGTSGASITANTTITLNSNGVNLSDKTVSLTDKTGAAVAISRYDNEKKTISLSNNMKNAYSSGSPFTLKVTDIEGNSDSVTVGVSSNLVENWFGSPALESLGAVGSVQPGLTLNGSSATFKTWAPIASKVSLLLYKDAKSLSTLEKNPIPMTMDKFGFWTVNNVDVTGFKYYKYRITNNDVDKEVADIWHLVASADSTASQIVSIDDASATPDDWESGYVNPWKGADYTDAVIYEMHIRDWSRAFVPDSTGKFKDITDALGANGSGAFAQHLKDLGVTHVQILPMFDYAETNADKNYNWGYNPYHYNVPEGRYVSYGADGDGTDAVKQMRAMIKAFHDAGLAVNMDVVYNHTSGTGSGSLYDMTIPEYFYRFDSQGSYSNGSGCGNEVATNHAVVKKYVIDSLKHWVNDYHINGFRFDLMGCHEQSTMKDIYEALYDIDPKIMVYGEPWTGGTSEVVSGSDSAVKTNKGHGAGAFDDDFRNGIKGGEFGGFKQGHVQGTFADAAICSGLIGGNTTRNKTGTPGLALHYVECHDNYTLFDKLAMSYLNKTEFSGDLFKEIGADGLAAVKAQNKLAAAYIFLSQGTPFINGGQEFLRTKKGDENSYASSDDINQIDLNFKTTYADIYNTYKGLIALRKANPAAFGANTSAKAETVSKGVTKYTTGDFCVYFNATDAAVNIDASGYTKAVDVSSGTPTESTTLPTKADAKSFVILKK